MTSTLAQTQPATGTVLTDAMLARFAERSPKYDRENAFFSDDFEELRGAGYLRSPYPSNWAGAASRSRTSCASSGGSARHAPATALAINMHLYWTGVAADLWRAGDKSLTVDPRGDDARRGLRRRPRRERQRHPRAAVDDEGRARRRRVSLHRPKVVRQPDAGLDVSRPPRHGHVRSVAPEDRPRVHAAGHRRATASRKRGTCWACGRRAATTRSSTACSSPIDTSRRVVPAGAAGIDHFVLGAVRVGAARLRQHLLRSRATRVRA